MDEQFQTLKKGEVLSVDDSAQILIGHRTFRVSEFAESVRTQLEYGLGGWTEEKDGWFSDIGIDCEVLRFGATGWQKGRVRISLEFCPEDEEQKSVNSVTETVSHDQESELADMLASHEEEPEFPELSDNGDLENFQADSLLDDVWQDMNQSLGEEHQY